MTTTNLDQKAAHYSQEIIKDGLQIGAAKEVENLITKTLGVLQEQGVYAMMLFLSSRTGKEKDIAPALRIQLYTLLEKELVAFTNIQETVPQAEAAAVLKFYSDKVCSNLDILFLVKDLYEQTLIYARYGAKAAAKKENSA